MRRVFEITVLRDGKQYDEGAEYELDEETAAALDIYTKELKKGGKNEDGANSSDTKPTGK